MLNLAGDDALKINSVSLCKLLWALKRDGWTQGSSQDIPDRASTQQVWEMGPRAEYHIPQQLQRAAKPLTTPSPAPEDTAWGISWAWKDIIASN